MLLCNAVKEIILFVVQGNRPCSDTITSNPPVLTPSLLFPPSFLRGHVRTEHMASVSLVMSAAALDKLHPYIPPRLFFSACMPDSVLLHPALLKHMLTGASTQSCSLLRGDWEQEEMNSIRENSVFYSCAKIEFSPCVLCQDILCVLHHSGCTCK